MLTAIRMKLYDLLVNRKPGISQRYHRAHDHRQGPRKYLSWIYLLWLNLACLLPGLRFLGREMGLAVYEEKRLPVGEPESAASRVDMDHLAEELMQYDVISFDVFDTLLLRVFSRPEDLFYMMGEELCCMDFRRIRMEAEEKARRMEYRKSGSYEVSLSQIWECMEQSCGIPAARGMELEMRCELACCRANNCMRAVYRKLKEAGKTVVFTTDMYLSEPFIRRLLLSAGYEGAEPIFVSSALKKSKARGELYECVKNSLGKTLRYAHVGDNRQSDVKMAKKHGLRAFWYPNVNRVSERLRACDMSPIIGSAYRAIVNNRIHCGDRQYSPLYEYGYIYGGLFVTGYCHFIHRFCRKNGIEKILFLSRDGAILRKAYRCLYPGEDTEYVYWSRFAAAKLAARYMKYDYLRKLVRHKANRGFSIRRVLEDMELSSLIASLGSGGIKAEEQLTDKNLERFLDFLNSRWQTILELYQPQRRAARQILKDQLAGCRRAAAVDIGWAGSGALALDVLVQKEWELPCEVTGIIAGTNSAFSAEPDMSDPMLLSGKLVSYLYSSGHNRELWKKHNPARDYNIYWELLTSSPEPPLKGYYWNGEQNRPEPRFSKPEGNPEGIAEIQRGILDFVKDYDRAFANNASMRQISGRDAYAPMLLAASCDERYLKAAAADFHLRIDVGI